MIDYANGKIYGIKSSQTDKIYIGSTTCQHLMDTARGQWSGKDKITKYDDAEIYLIESYPCNSKRELKERMQYWIEENKDICANVLSAKRTPEIKRMLARKDYERHKNHYLQKTKILHKKKCICECGLKYTYVHKGRHRLTKIHQKRMLQLSSSDSSSDSSLSVSPSDG